MTADPRAALKAADHRRHKEYRRRAEEAERSRAVAWSEGFDAGHQAARALNPEWPDLPRNPYEAQP